MANAQNPIAIIGAGAMGAGIAQVAAMAGWTVYLSDVDDSTVRKAIDGIEKRVNRQVEKNLLTSGQRDEIMPRLRSTKSAADMGECDLVIEAVSEDMALKTMVL